MKKREFMAFWQRHREAALRELYKHDPHGAACLAMSLLDIPVEGERLWRRHRHVLCTETVAAFERRVAAGGAVKEQGL